jgi:NADPH:quinone reductase-like Zn-dependent oxidoreductase
MRAHQFGGPEQLRFEDAPDPEVGAGQVLVRVRAAGINPTDLMRLSGRFPQAFKLPYIPGIDVSGEVEAVGPGVANPKVGDKVVGWAIGGGYAEKACLTASEAAPLPPPLSFAEGAAIPIPFYTAYHALHHKAAIRSGETVLISAGAGGVGVAAVQLAKAAGARVLTTVGSEEKVERTRQLGADAAINYRTQDFVAEVDRLTDGNGAHVIIESVAVENLARDFAALAPGGRIVLVGGGTGKPAETSFNVSTALRKDATICAMIVFNARALVPRMAEALTRLFVEGKIKAVVSKSYPLSEAPQAMNDLLAGKVIGKLVLIP